MNRWLLRFSLFGMLLALAGLALAVDGRSLAQPVPTLVPPTLVPTLDAGIGDTLLNESALARVKRDGVVRVGLLFNAPPFGELNIQGEVSGYDADLARSMAEAWGVTFEAVQVNRQNAQQILNSGQVDMLVAAQVHRRDLDTAVEFSLTYFPGAQSMLVRGDDGAARLSDMANRRIGYVLGSTSSEAIFLWQQRAGIGITVESFLTLDQAVAALGRNDIDGVVESRIQLQRLVQQQTGTIKILEENVGPEPFAIVVRRQDVNWRNLINKTLQFLARSGRMAEIQRTYFPNVPYPLDLIPIWSGLGDEAPKPDQFPDDVPFPPQYAMPRIQQAGVVRVAGVVDLPADAPESQRRLDALNRAIAEALATRWGVRVEFIPNSIGNAADLVASGQADLAVGLQLDWSWIDRVDLTAPYLLHGERLMVRSAETLEVFRDLRGQVVGIFSSEEGAADRIREIAASAQSGVRNFAIAREQDVPAEMLTNNNIRVMFGDSLKLIPLAQANPDQLRITTRGNSADPWYSRVYVGIGVPRNDLDFRLLVEYTLQELARSGQWQALLTPVMLPGDIPAFDIWPGVSDFMGYRLG